MQFNTLTIMAFLATCALVSAGCKGSDSFCGKCNGTKCKIGLINYKCSSTTQCVGTGGGDGTYCYIPDTGSLAGGPHICPVAK